MINQRLLGNSTNKTMLFDLGNLCQGLSGGWGQTMTTKSTDSWGEAYGTSQLNIGAGAFSGGAGSYSYAYRCSSPINLKPYSKIYVLYDYTHNSNVLAIFGVQAGTVLTYASSVSNSATPSRKTMISASRQMATATLDITNLQYNGYIYVSVCNRNSLYVPHNLKVYKVWLEW